MCVKLLKRQRNTKQLERMPEIETNDNFNEGVQLEGSISLRDLLDGGTRFTLRSNYQQYDDDDDMFPELETGEEGITLNNENIVSPWERSFSELKLSMTEIDNGIFKKIIKPPVNNIEMVGMCRVVITYTAYMEKETVAFDSSHMRGDSKTFVTGDNTILPGLELAVKSMKRGEESQFVIPYDLLFGEMGCPPRIKPKADALFVIQLLKFDQTGDENATETVNEADRRKYSVMIDKILEVKTSGIDFCRQGAWLKAANSFHRAINRLQLCQLANENEQQEQENHLIKLYTNVMLCHNKLDQPKKVCLAFKDLSLLTNVSRNAKALFQHGKALMKLGEFKQARDELIKAYRLEPHNTEIADQMRALDQKHSEHEKTEKNLWRKAMGNSDVYDGNETIEIDEKFKNSIKPHVISFQENNKESKYPLPNGLIPAEIASIKSLIQDMEIKLEIKDNNCQPTYFLNKINYSACEKHESNFCRKPMRNPDVHDVNEATEIFENVEDSIMPHINKFMENNNESKYPLSNGVPRVVIDSIKLLVKDMPLELETKHNNGQTTYFLSKINYSACEKHESNFCRKPMRNPDVHDVNEATEIFENVEDSIMPHIIKFMENNNESKYPLQNGLMPAEIASIKSLIQDMEIKLEIKDNNCQPTYFLNKINYSACEKHESNFCRKPMRSPDVHDVNEATEIFENVEDSIMPHINKFMENNNESKYPLSNGVPRVVIDSIKLLVKDMPLELETKHNNGQTTYFLSKIRK